MKKDRQKRSFWSKCGGILFEDIRVLRLTSKLVDLRTDMRTPVCYAEVKFSASTPTKKETDNRKGCLFLFGRSVEIRTPGLQYPKLARYQLRYTSKYLVLKHVQARGAVQSFRAPWRAVLHRRIVALCCLDTLGSARSLLSAVSLRKNDT